MVLEMEKKNIKIEIYSSVTLYTNWINYTGTYFSSLFPSIHFAFFIHNFKMQVKVIREIKWKQFSSSNEIEKTTHVLVRGIDFKDTAGELGGEMEM